MTTIQQVAEGAEAGRRAAWAKLHELRDLVEEFAPEILSETATRGSSVPFIVRWRLALRDAPVEFGAKGIALLLSTWMSSDGSNGRPGLTRLARAAGLHERTVRRHLHTAERLGWIVKEGGGYYGMAVVYRAVIPVDRDDTVTASA